MRLKSDKSILGIIVSVVTAAVTALFFVSNVVMKKIAKGVVFFGLQVPMIYLLYGAGLKVVFDFTLGVSDIDTALYMWGLYVSLAASAVITVRHLITPETGSGGYISRHSHRLSRRERNRRDREERMLAAKRSMAPQVSYTVYPPQREVSSEVTVRRQPLVYRSKYNPELVIHEYDDRYDVYCDDKLLRIEYK